MPKLPNTQPAIAINLLPGDPFLDSVIGKFLTWSLSIGRYIVVLTELIVILSFLSRFQLDRRLTDLNERIEQQKAIILSYQETENKFRTTQTKIDFLQKEQQANTLLESLTFLEKNLPVDVKLVGLATQSNSWSLSASALSAQGMKGTVEKIISLKPQSAVSLASVKYNTRTGTIDFEMSVKTEQKVTQPKNPTNDTKDADGGI